MTIDSNQVIYLQLMGTTYTYGTTQTIVTYVSFTEAACISTSFPETTDLYIQGSAVR